MPKIILTLAALTLFATACATEPALLAAGASDQLDREVRQSTATTDERDAAPGETLRMLESAWHTGRAQQKPVLVVLRTETCDRCALLSHYMADPALRGRLDERFVVLDIDVGMALVDSEGSTSEAQLPAVVLIDSRQPFESILASDQLVTFLPGAEEPLYDWMENILNYSAQILALH
ncbi:MAG: thioredoxin family protein [Pseudomonadales bacterium]